MKITHFHPEPIETIPLLNAGTGALPYFEDRLPVHHATVDRLPDGLSAIVVTADGLRIGGIGGIIGNPSKPQRREELDYFQTLERILSQKIDVLITHDGPCGTDARQRGDFRIREVLEQCATRLVIRGHKHWPHPLAQFPSGLQVLNVDKRVVIFTE